MRPLAATALLVPVLFATCSTQPGDNGSSALPPFQAPPVRTSNVTDDYHGVTVKDPYRWLEDQDGAETERFVQWQNVASRAFLDAVPERDAIRNRLTELWNYPRRGAPSRNGELWFFSRNDGLQDQDVVYVANTAHSDGEVLLDPNTFSEDGTTALAGFVPSRDGKLCAFATSTSGSDWQKWQVLNVATKEVLSDTLHWAKFTRAAWTKDGAGFFYQRYPTPEPDRIYESSNKNAQLCYHRIGSEQSEDIVVYERPDQPRWMFSPEVTESGRYLIVSVRAGSASENRIVYADLEGDDEENFWGSVSFTDVFSLVRINGSWQIVGKIFTHTGDTPPGA